MRVVEEGNVHCCCGCDCGTVFDALGAGGGFFARGLGLGGGDSDDAESGEESVVREIWEYDWMRCGGVSCCNFDGTLTCELAGDCSGISSRPHNTGKNGNQHGGTRSIQYH